MNNAVDLTNLPSEDEAQVDSRNTTSTTPTVVPTSEELLAICSNVKANFNFQVNAKPVLFRFKTTKDANGVEYKRDPLELPIPYPSVQGIIDILEAGGKQLELLMDAVEYVVTQQARAMISDDFSINATNLDVSKLSWDYIANMPKAERSGGGIAKEVWDDFAADYVKTMPAATGKTVEQVTRAAKLLQGKFAAVKTNIPVLELLMDQLAIYANNSKRADEFVGCVEFLVDKADKLINTTPEELLANL